MSIEAKYNSEIENQPHFDGEPFYAEDGTTQLGEWLQFEDKWVVGYFNEDQKQDHKLGKMSDEYAKKAFIDQKIELKRKQGK